MMKWFRWVTPLRTMAANGKNKETPHRGIASYATGEG